MLLLLLVDEENHQSYKNFVRKCALPWRDEGRLRTCQADKLEWENLPPLQPESDPCTCTIISPQTVWILMVKDDLLIAWTGTLAA